MSQDLTLPPQRAGREPDAELAERRKQMGAAVANGTFATKAPPIEEELAGLRTLRFKPAGPPRGWLLQLHGGGFRIGRPEFEGPYAEALAEACGIEVIVPQYRLGPEAPFPAAMTDTIAAYEAVKAEAAGGKLIVGGDSAGGNLAAALAIHAAAEGDDSIDGVILLSPWLDLTVTAGSFETNKADTMFSTESAQTASELYLQGFDPRHPLASPLFAEIGAFPPSYINVGTGEVLLDDAVRFHEKLQAAGAPSQLSVIEGMSHVAVILGRELPGSAQTFAEVTAFLESILS